MHTDSRAKLFSVVGEGTRGHSTNHRLGLRERVSIKRCIEYLER